MKSKVKYIIVFILLVIYIGRVYMVQAEHKIIPIKEYALKEEIEFTEGILFNREKVPSGYSIYIKSGELKTKDEVFKEFSLNEKDITNNYGLIDIPYFYIVKGVVKNHNNSMSEETGINIRSFILQYKCGYVMQNEDIFKITNSHLPGMGFSLLPNGSKEINLIYPVYDMYKKTMIKVIEKDSLYLILSIDPELTRIKLQ